jgi:hypothetical protein
MLQKAGLPECRPLGHGARPFGQFGNLRCALLGEWPFVMPRAGPLLKASLLLGLLATPAVAQTAPPATPTPSPGGAEATATPAPKIDTKDLLDQIGGCVESGKLNVEIDLLEGSVPAADRWIVETKGQPLTKITAEAASGRVQKLNVGVSNGTLLVAGKGLRPKVYIESLAFEDGKGVTEMKVHGKGIWKPLVALFRGLARSAVNRLQLRTDLPSVMRGEILSSSTTKAKKAGVPAPTPTPAPQAAAGPTPAPGPSFMTLVKEARVLDTEFVAYGGRPLGFGDLVHFETAANPKSGVPLKVAIDKASFRPGQGEGAAPTITASGRVEGEVENGEVGFGESHSMFSHGELKNGTFDIAMGESGKLETRIGASAFGVELTSGELHLPGGTEVDLDTPSNIAFADLRVEPDGRYSAVLDAELTGKVGRISRGPTQVSASNVKVRIEKAHIDTGHATGDLALSFEYRLDYLLVVRYPVKEVGEKKVPLVFQGPFQMKLHYQNASKDTGTVTGEYDFKVPWPPIETAALEVLKARWSQDVTPAMKRVDIDIEPRRFSPCGDKCFLLELGVVAEKKSGKKKSLFRQICEPLGKADLVVDAPNRTFQLKNIRIETHCKGVVGWFVNFLTPLLTKTYGDMTLFKMPENLPFTVEKVGTGMNWVALSGTVDYQRGAAKPAESSPSSQ